MCPRFVITEDEKKNYTICPLTGRFVRKNPQCKELRKNLTPGRVVILLSGVNAGKRAIFLRQLENGQILVNGPSILNGVPLTAIPQRHVIITSTKLDIKANTEGFTFSMLTRPLEKDNADAVAKVVANLAEW